MTTSGGAAGGGDDDRTGRHEAGVLLDLQGPPERAVVQDAAAMDMYTLRQCEYRRNVDLKTRSKTMTMTIERTTTTTTPVTTLPNPRITHHISAGETTVALPLLHAGQVVWLAATWSRHDHPRAVEVALDDAPLWACTLPTGAVLALLSAARTVALERMGRCQARDDARAAGVWAELATRLSAEREDYQCSMNDPGYAAWLATEGG